MEDERTMVNELMKSAEQRLSNMGESTVFSIATTRDYTTQFEEGRPGGQQMEEVQCEESDEEMSANSEAKGDAQFSAATVWRPVVSRYVLNWVQVTRLSSS